ncbi:hypothetical protein [Mycolicibacterium sp.]|uniref:hypothetical protein n=1 Tax=Mycolicibacterium sp. TaxID=2320850 RepID=UPI0037C902CE
MGPPWTALAVASAVLLVGCASPAPATQRPTPTATSVQAQQRPAGPPVDDTVKVTLTLVDSFDIHPDNTCSGRSSNAGITNGARVQLHGDTVGGSTWTTATTTVVRQPFVYHGEVRPEADDGVYCVAEMAFAPELPDPESRYSLKFVGGNWMKGTIHVGRAPFGQEDRPGYGSARITIQTCRTPAEPPDKDCPELED